MLATWTRDISQSRHFGDLIEGTAANGEAGLGTLIGTRTWGGLIGISANPQLIDGGTLTVPFFRFFDADGNFTIENEGVAPDIRVELDPLALDRGVDTQLDAAIAKVMADLEGNEDPVKPAPTYPTEIGK